MTAGTRPIVPKYSMSNSSGSDVKSHQQEWHITALRVWVLPRLLFCRFYECCTVQACRVASQFVLISPAEPTELHDTVQYCTVPSCSFYCGVVRFVWPYPRTAHAWPFPNTPGTNKFLEGEKGQSNAISSQSEKLNQGD